MAQAAGNVTIVLSVNQSNFTQAMTNAQQQLDKFAGKSKAAGHATVSGMQAASASIRLLDNPLGNNVRAIERLISQSKVLSEVLKAAFPLVGAIAIGAMLARLGTQVADFAKKVNETPKAIAQSFAALALSSKTATDELTLTNDKLDEATNKLNHKPSNAIKVGLDEMTLAADRFAASVVNSNGKLNDLLSKDHLSGFALLLGKPGTSEREQTTKRFSDQADDAAYDLANATTPAQTAAAQAKLQKSQSDQLSDARSDMSSRQSNAKNDDGLADTSNINIDKGIVTTILNQRKLDAAQVLNAQKEAAKQLADDRKTAAEQAKQAASAASELRLKNMEAALAGEKLTHDVSIKETYDYWTARISAFTKGSSAYDQVLAKQAAAAEASAAKAHEAIAKYRESTLRGNSSDETRLPELLNRNASEMQRGAVRDGGEQSQDYVDSNTLAMQNARNTAREQEAKLTDAAGRSMSKYDAAIQLASVHAQEFQTTMVALTANLGIRQQQAALAPSKETDKAVTEAQGAINEAQSTRTIQTQQDSDAIYGRMTSAGVGFTDALNDFVQSTRDNAAQMKEITNSTLSTLNSEFVKGISGQRTNFGNAGAAIFRNVAGQGIQKAEGSVLGAFGFGDAGKPDGSSSRPLYVRMADGVGNAASAAGGFLSKLFGGGSSGGSTMNSALSSALGGSSSSGPISTIGSVLTDVLPAFASGGTISAGTTALVGERGPELLSMGSMHGQITPNHGLTTMSSSGDTHIHVDATGSTDPAQTQAAVARGISLAAPHLTRNAMMADKEQGRRSPASVRRS